MCVYEPGFCSALFVRSRALDLITQASVSRLVLMLGALSLHGSTAVSGRLCSKADLVCVLEVINRFVEE